MGFFEDLRKALRKAEPVDRVVAEHSRISRLNCTKTNPCREARYHDDSEMVGPITEHTGEVVMMYRCRNCGCRWLAAES